MDEIESNEITEERLDALDKGILQLLKYEL